MQITIRNKNTLSASLHHGFFVDEKEREWNYKKAILKRPEKEKLRNSLIEFTSKYKKNDIRVANKNSRITFGKFNESFVVYSAGEALFAIDSWIIRFLKFVDDYKNEFGIF